MTDEKSNLYGQDEKDTAETGSDLPNADGSVSDEDVNKLDDDGSGKPIGQDHSTEDKDRKENEPSEGVGAVQRSSDTQSDIYHSK